MRDYPLTDSRSSHGSEQELREAFDLYQQIIDAVREGQQDPSCSRWQVLASRDVSNTGKATPLPRLIFMPGRRRRVPQWQPLFTLHCRRPQPPGKRTVPATWPGRSGYSATADCEFFYRSSNLLYEPEPRPFNPTEIKNYHNELIAKLAQKVDRDMPGSDRLIALAYRNGQYPLVTLMLKKTPKKMGSPPG